MTARGGQGGAATARPCSRGRHSTGRVGAAATVESAASSSTRLASCAPRAPTAGHSLLRRAGGRRAVGRAPERARSGAGVSAAVDGQLACAKGAALRTFAPSRSCAGRSIVRTAYGAAAKTELTALWCSAAQKAHTTDRGWVRNSPLRAPRAAQTFSGAALRRSPTPVSQHATPDLHATCLAPPQRATAAMVRDAPAMAAAAEAASARALAEPSRDPEMSMDPSIDMARAITAPVWP